MGELMSVYGDEFIICDARTCASHTVLVPYTMPFSDKNSGFAKLMSTIEWNKLTARDQATHQVHSKGYGSTSDCFRWQKGVSEAQKSLEMDHEQQRRGERDRKTEY